MNPHIEQIVNVLQELTDEHRQLVEYSKAKTEGIKQNNLDAISYISNKEKKALERIISLEQHRSLLVGKYLVSQRISGSERSFKMEKLIQYVYLAEEKQKLQQLWRELNAVISELQNLNEFNQQLVRMTLDYLHFTQDLLLGPEDEDVTYHRAVKGLTQNRSGRFNIKS
ncbi:flagellar protein FlgN [Paenibacillus sp. HB172176]|uniref:flagellar protein FlgN n=1 Tax=Paenibacillus sp. HB172176 TaxID=2493690 RepID=UPI00143C54A1|nr:flagellar protein FlgN [Paenibacillus sp. HB172176]